ncbi:hypothetical protein RBB75_06455 [Tunturibacter empetritectus]|uniref:Uncharacterized protein n=1 Tax=Tunturiibacter empetritectus TaxID=3069691 RepID=A0AAU7ZG34_9BACT
MLPLPEEVGESDGRCQGAAEPKPAMTQTLTKRRQADADNQPREPEDDGVLVEDRGTCKCADGKPEGLVAGLRDTHDEICDRGPEQGIEGVHGEQVGQGEGDGGHQRCK